MSAHRPFKIKDFGLSIVLLSLFLFSVIGHIIFGFQAFNEKQKLFGFSELSSYWDYIITGHFISSFSENMESEFLQMAIFVYLTMFLFQRGSAESKKQTFEKSALEVQNEHKEKIYSDNRKRQMPVLWTLYENSLTLVLTILFVFSFSLHSWGSFLRFNEEHRRVGLPLISFSEIFSENDFWFESFQNWQSEFFSVAVLVGFSIFLRQRGSPQSKKMNDSTWKTGSN